MRDIQINVKEIYYAKQAYLMILNKTIRLYPK